MLFIHQFPDWTHFRFENRRVLDALGKTRFEEGRLAGLLTFVGSKDLETEIIAEDIVANFAIDGHSLNIEDVKKELVLRSQAHTVHIRNYLGAIENCMNPLTPERLLGWHSALTGSRTAGYREDAYEISSADMRFAGPGPERLQTETGHFFDWFESSPMDGIIKAAIAHALLVPHDKPLPRRQRQACPYHHGATAMPRAKDEPPAVPAEQADF